MRQVATVIAAFGAGFAATWWIGRAAARRRKPARYSDAQLRERVQAQLAGLLSDPDAVSVSVQGGVVRLSGRVVAAELHALLMQVKDLPGVHMIHNALSTFDDAQGSAGPDGQSLLHS